MSNIPDNIRKMWEAAALGRGLSSLSSHEKHISDIHARSKGRELTGDEKAAIDRHRQNAIDAEKRAAAQREQTK